MAHMQHPAVERGARIVGIVLTVIAGVPFLLLTWVALSSRFGIGSGDPHGYGLIFGTFFALVAGLALAFVVPLLFPSGRRSRAYVGSLIAYVALAVALFLLLLTA